MSLAESRRLGERSESTAVERLPIRYVGDSEAEHYDAVLTDDVDEANEGDPAEIKSASVVISRDRPGMWYLRKRQHERLAGDDGWYLLLVSSPRERQMLAYTFMAAESVAEQFIDNWWPGAETRSEFRQIPWTLVFDESDLQERDRR